eukprot:1084237-Alexandrium_andersonii.AAC.1
MCIRDRFKYAPSDRYRPAMVPDSRSDSPAAAKLLVHQRVFSSCYTRTGELRTEPVGIPPKPKAPGPPAEGGAKK